MKIEGSKKVIVSVPGKINLMGEHAIVLGKPSLLSAINMRLYATVTPNPKGLTIKTTEETKLIEKAVEAVMERLKLTGKPKITITITSQLPTGRHVGSSAAVSVATIGALLYYLKKIWNPNLINELAYEVEKFQHGNPSGGDNTAVTFGGLIYYRKEFEFLKSIWQLPFKVSSKLTDFYLVDTGRPQETTGEMVKMVGEFVKTHPKDARNLLDDNEQATRDVTVAVKTGDEKLFIDAIKRGERTLEGLSVVSQKVIPLIRDVEKLGGAAKILGGGGKKDAVGLVLCYHRNKQELEAVARKYSYQCNKILLGEEGIRLESGKT